MDAVERVERQLLLDLRELLNKAPISFDKDTDWLTLDSLRVFLDRIDAALSLARSNGWQDIGAVHMEKLRFRNGRDEVVFAATIKRDEDGDYFDIPVSAKLLDRLGGSDHE